MEHVEFSKQLPGYEQVTVRDAARNCLSVLTVRF